MLGLKSFRSAAITLAGIELAHRIHKRQFSLVSGASDPPGSLKELWNFSLRGNGDNQCPKPAGLAPAADAPELKQRLGPSVSRTESLELRPLRHSRKVATGRGLYLLLAPRGGRYWRFNYTFEGKHKTLALGVYPDVPAALAKNRHQEARRHLARGVDPMVGKRDLQIRSLA